MSAESPIHIEISRAPGAEDLPLPTRQTSGASGYDLHAAVTEPVTLAPGRRALIPTGFHISIPEGYEAQIRGRSGLANKHGIGIPNSPGTIDSDYRGEVKVILINWGDKSWTVARGDRIAQMVFAKVEQAKWIEVETLSESKRGAGGFGHTG